LRAEDHFQRLQHGINLLNLLMFYPAPPNEAVVTAVDALLDEERLRLAVLDLEQLERHLLELPESPGPELKCNQHPELPGGPLRDLLVRLERLHALYLGKSGKGGTLTVQQQLREAPFADLHTLQLAVVNLHQLKAGV